MIESFINAETMKNNITLHFDYVDGMAYVECSDRTPVTFLEYSTYPYSTFVSYPCVVVTRRNEIKKAFFVTSCSVFHHNDGSVEQYEGFVEIDDDGEPISDHLYNAEMRKVEFLDVLRWHYTKPEMVEVEKQFLPEQKNIIVRCQGTTSNVNAKYMYDMDNPKRYEEFERKCLEKRILNEADQLKKRIAEMEVCSVKECKGAGTSLELHLEVNPKIQEIIDQHTKHWQDMIDKHNKKFGLESIKM